jgi:hypothetical protein
VHTEQAGLRLLDEVGAADVGRQHGLFDQRCASLRVRGTIFSMRPLSSQTICVSVVSKSTAPRAWRA